jgi:hypothetical protein
MNRRLLLAAVAVLGLAGCAPGAGDLERGDPRAIRIGPRIDLLGMADYKSPNPADPADPGCHHFLLRDTQQQLGIIPPGETQPRTLLWGSRCPGASMDGRLSYVAPGMLAFAEARQVYVIRVTVAEGETAPCAGELTSVGGATVLDCSRVRRPVPARPSAPSPR